MQRNFTPSHPFHALLSRVLVWCCFFLTLDIAAEPVFHIECPPDVTVSCTAELWDLSGYGNAQIYGYGAPQSAGPPISVDYNLSSCNTGNIIRTWVAYDYGGQPYYCSQNITVSGTGGYANIHWPPDYTIHSCSPMTDPDDLPSPYDRPDISGGGTCSQLMMSYDDLVFNINPPACKKIVRTWTVVDWCIYNPNSYHPEGIWEYTQIIKITPENPPTIWCPADTTFSAGSDCSGGYVQLPSAWGTSDCGAGVTITNSSPYAHTHGANASGNYPIGTTKVSFWADDGCGQKASCSMYVTVKDMKKPTPVCYYGISVSLMQMPDGYYMDLRPSFFDKGSFDNCTPKHKLKMWVEPSRVDCQDIGPTAVRVFVEDESGNKEYCNTLVYVQDNMGMCPPNSGDITGEVQTLSGEMMEQVDVSLVELSDHEMTDVIGSYAFPSVPFGKAYTVSPSYPDDNINGVSALDMALLLKHILGVESFTSSYQYVAADIDKSGRVSVNDLLLLKELILKDSYGVDAKTSWRFIDATFDFAQGTNPLATPLPETYHIPMFTESMTALDFVGVKLGDVSGDAVAQLNGSTTILSRTAGIVLHVPEMQLKHGETIEFPVVVEGYAAIEAMQFGIAVNNSLLDVVSVLPNTQIQGLDIVNKTHDFNVISGLWYGMEPLPSSVLFTVSARVIASGSLSNALTLVSDNKSIGYRYGDQNAVRIDLTFATGSLPNIAQPSASVGNKMKLGQNYPNPFSDITLIPIELAEEGILNIGFYDVNGMLLDSWDFFAVKGLQEIPVYAERLKGKGVVLCRITSGEESATIRLLLNTGS